MGKTVITNGIIVTETRLIPNGSLVIEDGRILDILEGAPVEAEGAEIIDAAGQYISPGFIDIHVHGGGGYEFMCENPQDAIEVCKMHLSHGTTSLLPTTSSAEKEAFVKSMDSINSAAKLMKDGPNLLGIHMEGPYFAMNQRGAQDIRYLRNPDPTEYLDILDKYPNILRWSAAPELPGALEMAALLGERGVHLSIGHSDALYEEAIQAFEHGFRTITHFYSCISTVRRINAYRYAGIVEAGYQLDDMMVEVIADGKHLPASLLKLIYKIKGADRICLVTDGVGPAGLPDGGEMYSKTCGIPIIVEDGVAKVEDRSAFAGSVATTDRLVRTMRTLAEVPMCDAVKMMTATPAKNIGVFDRKGSIAIGKDADIVLFNEHIDVSRVLVNGKTVV